VQANKAYEKYEKQLRAAKQSGKNSKQNQEKVIASVRVHVCVHVVCVWCGGSMHVGRWLWCG
jgi:fructoselysine-6-P-deglycase FrlB-like protein